LDLSIRDFGWTDYFIPMGYPSHSNIPLSIRSSCLIKNNQWSLPTPKIRNGSTLPPSILVQSIAVSQDELSAPFIDTVLEPRSANVYADSIEQNTLV
jgi:hypothetical protein